MGKKDLLNFGGLSREDMFAIFDLAADLKQKLKAGIAHPLLARRCLAMIFEKPSLRTRVTFEAGMVQLGGHAVFLGPNEVQLGVRETPADCARSLSRWVDIISVRTFFQETLEEMARYATVPVINALSDASHPCQVLADCLTLIEHRGKLDGLKVTFLGDGNNVARSWIEAAEKLPISFALACPKGYEPSRDLTDRARNNGARILITRSVEEAVSGADVVYTDVWASMGQEREAVERAMVFRDYQINERLVGMAKKDAMVMHCLPAHRGQEITHEVLESAQSIVFDQAENRLHVQKAIMVWLLQS
ncbi:MAG: ornithine carbamoyltransferase [Deltaproteobacteria bacterium]|nr:ornithine carbamoyltransferase [Deltaproteobacteria bacterium]MDZ4341413.1 ornithine carbamoyltransferase [Candidatus Binatia bacterium]